MRAGRPAAPWFAACSSAATRSSASTSCRHAAQLTPFLRVDLSEFGQTVESLAGADAVVHLAAIPASEIATEETTFRTNMLSTYNAFEAARVLGLQRVVWASSETILGLPFERERPAYAPIDEGHPPYPESSYAVSKLLSVELARQLNRWTGTPFVALRFSNIMEPQVRAVPSFWDDARLRRWNLWGSVLGYTPRHPWRDHLDAS